MFDAKSLFDQIMKAGQPPAQQSPAGQGGGLGDIGDLLRQFTQNSGGSAQPQGGQAQPRQQDTATGTGAEGGSALDDLLRQFSTQSGAAPASGGPGSSGSGSGNPTSSGSNPLEDLLRQLTQDKGTPAAPASGMQELPQSSAPPAGGAGGAGGGLGDILGQVFGQGRDGGAGTQPQSNQSPGSQTPDLGDLLKKLGGGNAASGDLLKQLTDFIGNNKVGAGAALGGLGALIFGTQTGRSLAMGAAKIGALAVVGGLAYKAYNNYSQGRPLISGSIPPEAAPKGTGFEAEEVSNEAAVTYIRGMIAAAAADGRIDASEQQQIIGSLSQQGIDAAAEEFLANELNNPASIEQLVAGVTNQTEGLQLYTAARVAIEPDTGAEQHFLAVLAERLGIPADLRAHVDAAARGVS
jgi:uncharacterized membrane protein YebE (DUF533 family)